MSDAIENLSPIHHRVTQSGTNEPARQAAVFFLLEQMAEYSEQLKSSVGGLVSIFQTALAESMPASVRLAAVKALFSLVINLQADDQLKGVGSKGPFRMDALKPLAPAAFACVALSLEAQVSVQN